MFEFNRPVVMGIINATPDSFFEGSRVNSAEAILSAATKMIKEGAEILDVGGYSSRPGAADVSITEECERVQNAIQIIRSQFPNILISVDTFRAKVAAAGFEAGANIVNDISGGKLDDKMFQTVAELNMPYIMMHMKGSPQTMSSETEYEHLVKDINYYFSEQIFQARQAGIKDIIIDPGFGFAKSIEQNFELMQKLDLLQLHDCPILVGISRKSMIYKSLGITAQEALNGTSVLNGYALEKGAMILRVHDVKEAVEAVQLHSLIHCAE